MSSNNPVVVLTSAPRTATPTIPPQVNHAWRGLHLIINVTAVVSTPSVTPKIQGQDPVSGKWYDILEGNPITEAIVVPDGEGMTVLKVYPGTVAIEKLSADDILPRVWRVEMVHLNTDSITYSVGANLVI